MIVYLYTVYKVLPEYSMWVFISKQYMNIYLYTCWCLHVHSMEGFACIHYLGVYLYTVSCQAVMGGEELVGVVTLLHAHKPGLVRAGTSQCD